jgi:hypothetical protein
MKYYVYRWIRLDKNEPFYIGIGTKTKNDIEYGTFTRAASDKKNNTIWKGIKDKTSTLIQIVLESDNYEFIKCKEKEFINLYGRIDLGTGSLANLTDGGEGTLGVIVNEHSRKLRSINSKNRIRHQSSYTKMTNTRKQNNFMQTQETKDRISATKSMPVIQWSLKGNYIKLWNSATIAAKELNISKGSISQCACATNAKVYTAGGYIWSYDSSESFIKVFLAVDKVASGKTRSKITISQKKQIKEDYLKLCVNFTKKIDLYQHLSKKHHVNFSTVRAIVYNL